MKCAIFYLYHKPGVPQDSKDYRSFSLNDGTVVWIRTTIVEAKDDGEALDVGMPRENESVMNAHQLPSDTTV